jgi:hypothetical protein
MSQRVTVEVLRAMGAFPLDIEYIVSTGFKMNKDERCGSIHRPLASGANPV